MASPHPLVPLFQLTGSLRQTLTAGVRWGVLAASHIHAITGELLTRASREESGNGRKGKGQAKREEGRCASERAQANRNRRSAQVCPVLNETEHDERAWMEREREREKIAVSQLETAGAFPLSCSDLSALDLCLLLSRPPCLHAVPVLHLPAYGGKVRVRRESGG